MNHDDVNKFLPLARRIAHQSETERAEGLRSIDPAILRACVEVMRIRSLSDGEEELKDER